MNTLTTTAARFALVLLFSLLFLGSAWPQQYPHKHSNEIMMGAGVVLKPIYSGSDKLTSMVTPFIKADYSLGYGKIFFEFDTAGVELTGKILSFSAGFSFGENRRYPSSGKFFTGEKDHPILSETPELINPIRYFGKISASVGFGKLQTSLYYSPVEARYKDTPHSNQDYNGLLTKVAWQYELNSAKKFHLLFDMSAHFMNNDYAAAYYGVQFATARLPVYKAEAGLRDIATTIMFGYSHTKEWSSFLLMQASYLSGDAGSSPLTQNKFQPLLSIGLLYVF